jgi:hypothetical protein
MSLPPVYPLPVFSPPVSSPPSSSQPSSLQPGSEPEGAPTSNAKHVRSFMRAFVATNYLLGKRHSALAAGTTFTDPQALMALAEITDQLSHGVQEHRARVLAAEVGRLMRSLGSQKLK